MTASPSPAPEPAIPARDPRLDVARTLLPILVRRALVDLGLVADEDPEAAR